MSSIEGSSPLPHTPSVSGAGPGLTFNDAEANQMSYFLREFLRVIVTGIFSGRPMLDSDWSSVKNYFNSAMSKQPISDQTLNDLQEHLNHFIQQLNPYLSSLSSGRYITPWNVQSDHFIQGSQFLSHLAEVGWVCRAWEGGGYSGGMFKNAMEELENFLNYGPVWSPQTMSQAAEKFISHFNDYSPFSVSIPNYQNFW
jgi:hypothetical protein